MTFTDGQKIVIFKDEGGAYSYIKKKEIGASIEIAR
jgi:hypothetical protein